MEAASLYLESTRKQFNSYKTLGDKTFEQLSSEELNRIPAPGSNSIAVIIKHMHGNLVSRFTNFLSEDGEKPWRQREQEFSLSETLSKEELLDLWEKGWNCLFNAMDELVPDDLTRTVTIRTEPHTVLDALNRQLAHHVSHVGQIVYLGKMYRQENWKPLSIPRGGTEAFNNKMAGKS